MGICTWFARLAKGSPAVEKKPRYYIALKNESGRLIYEIADLPNQNKELYDLILDVAEYVGNKYNKTITITVIYRTQEEQEGIYGVGYKKKSPHQFWQGIDLRSRDFTDSEISDIIEYINSKYDGSNYYDWTAKNHSVGKGIHFHIQYYLA